MYHNLRVLQSVNWRFEMQFRNADRLFLGLQNSLVECSFSCRILVDFFFFTKRDSLRNPCMCDCSGTKTLLTSANCWVKYKKKTISGFLNSKFVKMSVGLISSLIHEASIKCVGRGIHFLTGRPIMYLL